MSILSDEHARLLSRVRARVERGERIAVEDIAELFTVTDTSALARIARIPRERRFGRDAYVTRVRRIAYRGQAPDELLRELAAPTTGVMLEPEPGVPQDAVSHAARVLSASHSCVVAATATWIHDTATRTGASIDSVLTQLRASCTTILDGSDAGVLDDSVLTPSRALSADEWIAVHRAAHALGVRTVSAMTYFTHEAPASYAAHLDALRTLQDETGGIMAFTALPEHRTELEASYLANPTAHQSLRTIAIARIALDNVDHIASAPALVTAEVAVVALSYGADALDMTARSPSLRAVSSDIGSLPVVAHVQETAVVDDMLVEARMVEARFTPVVVDAAYEVLESTGKTSVGAA